MTEHEQSTRSGEVEHAPAMDPPILDGTVSRQCLDAVERYKSGQASKMATLLELQRIIPQQSCDDEAYVKAFTAYGQMCEGFDEYRRTAGSAGRSSHTYDNEAIGDDQPVGPARAEREIDQPNKRTDLSDDEDDTHPSKRKIDVDLLPWYSSDREAKIISEPLRKTQSILENYGRDIKFARRTLLNSFACPQFPYSQWTNLLSGVAVDLDHVLSGLFAISQDTRQAETTAQGETIIQGDTAPALAKSVKSQGDWDNAWRTTAKATAFAFPHRRTELEEYGEYIDGLFAASPPAYHKRIIRFDRAVRVRVAQRRDLLLTDTNRFSDLFMHWIQSPSLPSRADCKEGKPKRKDPCRRWNENRCPSTTATCGYAHVCAKCRSNAHKAPDCTSTAKK